MDVCPRSSGFEAWLHDPAEPTGISASAGSVTFRVQWTLTPSIENSPGTAHTVWLNGSVIQHQALTRINDTKMAIELPQTLSSEDEIDVVYEPPPEDLLGYNTGGRIKPYSLSTTVP
jgi:hypothetical protein